eukprot:364361-Chlamydomonas_euryale.AAC.2
MTVWAGRFTPHASVAVDTRTCTRQVAGARSRAAGQGRPGSQLKGLGLSTRARSEAAGQGRPDSQLKRPWLVINSGPSRAPARMLTWTFAKGSFRGMRSARAILVIASNFIHPPLSLNCAPSITPPRG